MRSPLGKPTPRRIDLPFRPGAMPPLFGDTSSVLIVDDDPVVGQLLRDILEAEGYTCCCAEDAEQARARLAEQEFAVALIDIVMPGHMSGLELVEQALRAQPFLAIVMVTGIDDPGVADLALRSGAYGYLVKPFTSNEVLVSVTNAGRRRCLEIEAAVYRHRLEERLEEQTFDLDDALMQLKVLYEAHGFEGSDANPSDREGHPERS